MSSASRGSRTRADEAARPRALPVHDVVVSRCHPLAYVVSLQHVLQSSLIASPRGIAVAEHQRHVHCFARPANARLDRPRRSLGPTSEDGWRLVARRRVESHHGKGLTLDLVRDSFGKHAAELVDRKMHRLVRKFPDASHTHHRGWLVSKETVTCDLLLTFKVPLRVRRS